jgi:hypothetical protein
VVAGAERRPVGIGGVGIGQERADPALPEAGAVVEDIDVVDADDVRSVASAAASVGDEPDKLHEIRACLPPGIHILGLDQQDAVAVDPHEAGGVVHERLDLEVIPDAGRKTPARPTPTSRGWSTCPAG